MKPKYLLLIAVIICGCFDNESDLCSNDDDCGNNEICDFISGNCVPVIGAQDVTEGEFNGTFSCRLAPNIEDSQIGQSHVVGGWDSDVLELNSGAVCFVFAADNVQYVRIDLLKKVSSTEEYIITLLMKVDALLGGYAVLELQSDGAFTNQIFGADLYHALKNEQTSEISETRVGAGSSGSLEMSGKPQIGELLEGDLTAILNHI